MNTSQSVTKDSESSAIIVGKAIRSARQQARLTISELAEKIGRPREWLNRIELGYSEYGEHRPASSADLRTLFNCLGADKFSITQDQLLEYGRLAEASFAEFKRSSKSTGRNRAGKLTQAEVIIGEEEVSQAIVDLIQEQHSDAVIRNTGIKGLGSYVKLTESWRRYREALGDFLTRNPNALFKRVEFAANAQQLELAKQADSRLAGKRNIRHAHNAKIKFKKDNPLQLHVLIGQREAILALPQASGQAGSSMALLVRDKIFVEAMRVWYDEVLWESPGPGQMVRFDEFEKSFEEIKSMYGF